MKLWTSNFAKSSGDPRAVAICRTVPRWYKGARYVQLAPSSNLMRISDQEEYTRRYRDEVLSHLDPYLVANELGEGAVMLCYEPSTKFCHRQVVAEWLRAEGFEVVEVESRKQKTAPAAAPKPKAIPRPSDEEAESPQDLFQITYERLLQRPARHTENRSIVGQLRYAIERGAMATADQLRYMELVCS